MNKKIIIDLLKNTKKIQYVMQQVRKVFTLVTEISSRKNSEITPLKKVTKNVKNNTAVQMKRAVTAFAISLFFCKLIKGFLKK